MYHPYLYGKQKELLAVRQLAPTLVAGESRVAPVLEPVRVDGATLRLTLKACEKAGLLTYVIVNPSALQFSGYSAAAAGKWGRQLFDHLESDGLLRFIKPTFLIGPGTTAAEIVAFNNAYISYEASYVIKDASLPVSTIKANIADFKGASRLFLCGTISVEAINSYGKMRCIHVADRFPHKKRNADYVDGGFFTDAHLNYVQAGYLGFSDYTILSSVARDGGGRPGAVAFHLTWKKSPVGDVHVAHFVSERQEQADNDDAGKFM